MSPICSLVSCLYSKSMYAFSLFSNDIFGVDLKSKGKDTYQVFSTKTSVRGLILKGIY